MFTISKNLLQEGIVLLMITIGGFMSCLFYEIGNCKFYGIPTEYIVIEISKHGKLLYIIAASLLLLLLVTQYFYFSRKVRSVFFRGLIRVAIVLVIGFELTFPLYLGVVLESAALILTIFLCLISMMVFRNRIEGKEDLKFLPLFPSIPILTNDMGYIISYCLLLITILCYLSLNAGVYLPFYKKEYDVNADKSLALIKRYGTISLYNRIISDTLIRGQVIIDFDGRQIDTFRAHSLGGIKSIKYVR